MLERDFSIRGVLGYPRSWIRWSHSQCRMCQKLPTAPKSVGPNYFLTLVVSLIWQDASAVSARLHRSPFKATTGVSGPAAKLLQPVPHIPQSCPRTTGLRLAQATPVGGRPQLLQLPQQPLERRAGPWSPCYSEPRSKHGVARPKPKWFRVLSHQCWYIIYYPKFRARISCTIPDSELWYCVLSQGMYWYILCQNLGPWSRIRAIRAPLPLSSLQPRPQIWALTCPLCRIWATMLPAGRNSDPVHNLMNLDKCQPNRPLSVGTLLDPFAAEHHLDLVMRIILGISEMTLWISLPSSHLSWMIQRRSIPYLRHLLISFRLFTMAWILGFGSDARSRRWGHSQGTNRLPRYWFVGRFMSQVRQRELDSSNIIWLCWTCGMKLSGLVTRL